jgi:anti-anti-sigma factor
MPGEPFSAHGYEHNGDTVLALHGDINRAAEDGLAAAYEEVRSGPGRLVLDFGAVDFINSTGIALIVRLLADARAAKREVAAFGLTDHYREIFSITRLSDFMTVYRDGDAALADS